MMIGLTIALALSGVYLLLRRRVASGPTLLCILLFTCSTISMALSAGYFRGGARGLFPPPVARFDDPYWADENSPPLPPPATSRHLGYGGPMAYNTP
jgi:hypothetical protein